MNVCSYADDIPLWIPSSPDDFSPINNLVELSHVKYTVTTTFLRAKSGLKRYSSWRRHDQITFTLKNQKLKLRMNLIVISIWDAGSRLSINKQNTIKCYKPPCCNSDCISLFWLCYLENIDIISSLCPSLHLKYSYSVSTLIDKMSFWGQTEVVGSQAEQQIRISIPQMDRQKRQTDMLVVLRWLTAWFAPPSPLSGEQKAKECKERKALNGGWRVATKGDIFCRYFIAWKAMYCKPVEMERMCSLQLFYSRLERRHMIRNLMGSTRNLKSSSLFSPCWLSSCLVSLHTGTSITASVILFWFSWHSL